MSGLPKEAIIKMLKKNIHFGPYPEAYQELIDKILIPNIAEVIEANNEAILFSLKEA
jgi:hypothetical protein